jgi:hypothetical protein
MGEAQPSNDPSRARKEADMYDPRSRTDDPSQTRHQFAQTAKAGCPARQVNPDHAAYGYPRKLMPSAANAGRA